MVGERLKQFVFIFPHTFLQRAVVDRMSWQCGDDPVQQVGKFLQYTSKLYTNKAKILTENKKLKLKTVISKSQLVDIVYEVYGGKASKTLLKPHLLLICGSETSENALEVMFKRAKKFIDVYMIIGVDKLCFKLQEVSLQLSIDLPIESCFPLQQIPT